MSRVKICGLRRMEDIEAITRYRPDACGFILSQPYRRYVEKQQLRQMKKMVPADITAFGVFVNEPLSVVSGYVVEGLVDAVQLHGEEDNSYILSLKSKFPSLTVMKAFTVRSSEDVEKAKASCADLVLLDSGKGTGKTFRWELLKGFDRPYVLAGGLNPDNVEEAVEMLHPYGVDTSSGVETDGIKDSEKIRLFVERAKKEK